MNPFPPYFIALLQLKQTFKHFFLKVKAHSITILTSLTNTTNT